MLAGEARAELDVASRRHLVLDSRVSSLVVVVKLSEFVSSSCQEVGDMQPSPESQQLSLHTVITSPNIRPTSCSICYDRDVDTIMNTNEVITASLCYSYNVLPLCSRQ